MGHHENPGVTPMLTPDGLVRGTDINILPLEDRHSHEFLSAVHRGTSSLDEVEQLRQLTQKWAKESLHYDMTMSHL